MLEESLQLKQRKLTDDKKKQTLRDVKHVESWDTAQDVMNWVTWLTASKG